MCFQISKVAANHMFPNLKSCCKLRVSYLKNCCKLRVSYLKNCCKSCVSILKNCCKSCVSNLKSCWKSCVFQSQKLLQILCFPISKVFPNHVFPVWNVGIVLPRTSRYGATLFTSTVKSCGNVATLTQHFARNCGFSDFVFFMFPVVDLLVSYSLPLPPPPILER
jgi:hypothetical protein